MALDRDLHDPRTSAPASGFVFDTVTPGSAIRMRTDGAPHTLHVLAGRLKSLVVTAGESRWVELTEGQVLEVPAHARWSLRNRSGERAHVVIAA